MRVLWVSPVDTILCYKYTNSSLQFPPADSAVTAPGSDLGTRLLVILFQDLVDFFFRSNSGKLFCVSVLTWSRLRSPYLSLSQCCVVRCQVFLQLKHRLRMVRAEIPPSLSIYSHLRKKKKKKKAWKTCVRFVTLVFQSALIKSYSHREYFHEIWRLEIFIKICQHFLVVAKIGQK
jgi:hypothetical protein